MKKIVITMPPDDELMAVAEIPSMIASKTFPKSKQKRDAFERRIREELYAAIASGALHLVKVH